MAFEFGMVYIATSEERKGQYYVGGVSSMDELVSVFDDSMDFVMCIKCVDYEDTLAMLPIVIKNNEDGYYDVPLSVLIVEINAIEKFLDVNNRYVEFQSQIE